MDLPMPSQTDVLRRLEPSGRMRLMFGLIESMRRAVASGVRYRHPEYSSEEVRWAAARRIAAMHSKTS